MEPFTVLRSVAAPLLRQNVDTDVIIRIERLFQVKDPAELGGWAFEPLRYLAEGVENPEFVLNQDPYRGARILLAGRNFGCGSSREGAVWALAGMGIRCVIASSFGGIFAGNCFQNGLLPITLAEVAVESLAQEARERAGEDFTVDLEAGSVTTPGGATVAFAIPAARREQLLLGLDEIGMTLRNEERITAFQERDRALRPWVYLPPAAK